MRLYHKDLDRTIDVPDDDGLFGVLKESGWSKTIPAEHTNQALAPEQPDVVYQPVPAAEPAKTRRTSKSD